MLPILETGGFCVGVAYETDGWSVGRSAIHGSGGPMKPCAWRRRITSRGATLHMRAGRRVSS